MKKPNKKRLNKDILVNVSGGKDSQACLKLMVAKHGADRVLGVFADTKWEHPLTYKHLDTMRKLYGVEIAVISAGDYNSTGGDSVESQIRTQGDFPSRIVRFCTSRLKTRPLQKFASAHAEARREHIKDLTVYTAKCLLVLGIRTEESNQRAKRYAGITADEIMTPSECLSDGTNKFDRAFGVNFPIIDWTTYQVMQYLGDEVNPLYAAGFKRVGCFPCLAHESEQGLQNAYNFGAFGAEQKQRVIALENHTGKKHKGSNFAQACLFCQM